MRFPLLISALVFLLGCEESTTPLGDALIADAEIGDASHDAVVPPDSGDNLFGVISGPCGVLDEEITSADGAFFTNAIEFEIDFDRETHAAQLTEGAQQIIEVGTAGGSSELSEAFSFEILARCELATFVKSETEVVYDTEGALTDILVAIDGMRIGVSVTRAVSFPRDSDYDVETARTLLERKFEDILESTANVSEEDAWVKQILYIMADESRHADAMLAAYEMVDDAVRADTIVMVTVSAGEDAFIYTND